MARQESSLPRSAMRDSVRSDKKVTGLFYRGQMEINKLWNEEKYENQNQGNRKCGSKTSGDKR